MSAHTTAMLHRLIAWVAIFVGLVAACPAWAQSSEGTDFWLVFNPNNNAAVPDLGLGISSKIGATVTVTATPGKASTAATFTQTFTLAPNESRLVSFPSTLKLDTDGQFLVDRNSVHVVSSAPVSIVGRYMGPAISDAYLGLPVAALGTDYRVVEYRNLGAYLPAAKIVATDDNTTITFFPPGRAKAGDGSAIPQGGSRTLTLQRGETALFQADGTNPNTETLDLAGGRVVSNKPVAVVASTACANVPVDFRYCNHLTEMMPPITTLAQSFILVPTKRAITGDLVRVVGVADDTAIYANGALRSTLSKGEFYEFLLDTPVDLKANRPVLVAQFMRGTTVSGGPGDPSEMLVIPTAQFMSSYNVAATFPGDTSSARFTQNYLNVVIPTGAVSTLKLDGVPAATSPFVPIAGTSFSSAAIAVAVGPHRAEAALPFGVYAYGLGEFDAYSLPAGMSARTLYDTSDPFPPNARLVEVAGELRGLATDSSDTNANGLLDPDELIWGSTIGPRSEDTNMNNVLDPGEDRNGNGRIDRDLGLKSIELATGSSNLVLDVSPFAEGDGAASFVVRRIDAAKDGLGTLLVTDLAGNSIRLPVALVNGTTIKNVHVREVISHTNINLDFTSFATPPASLKEFADRYEIEWFYPVASTLSDIDLSHDVTFKSPVARESRVVTRELTLDYEDSAGNPVHYAADPQSVTVLPTALDISASIDRSEYLVGQNGTLTINVKNIGLAQVFATPMCVRLLDANGADALTPFTMLAPILNSAASTTLTRALTLTSYVIGQYQVRIDAYAGTCNVGAAIKTIALPFTIVDQPGFVAIDSSLSLDRAFYQANDRVLVDTLVRNLHPQNVAAGYAVRLQVVRPNGTSLPPQTRAVNTLVPLNDWRATFTFALQNEAPGIYTALLQLLDANGAIVQNRSTSFTVQSSSASGFGLVGTLSATPAAIPAGNDVRFDYTLRNAGNSGYTALPLTLRVVNAQTQALVTTIAFTADLAAGATQSGNRIWTTQGSEGDQLIVALSATVAGKEVALAQGTMTLLAPEVKLTGSLSASPKTVPVGNVVTFAYRVDNAGSKGFTALPAKVRIAKQGAGVVAELPLGVDVAAGGSTSGNVAWTATGAAGDLLNAVMVVVVAGKEITLGKDSLSLVAADRGQYFSGTVTATPKEVVVGDTASFTFTVQNQGPVSYTSLPVALRIVNTAANAVLLERRLTFDLAPGAAHSGNESWVTQGNVGDKLVARLVITFAGTDITLGEAPFWLKAPPVKLVFSQAIERASRVLALAACAPAAPANPQQCGPGRAQAIDGLLGGLGIMHLVTNDVAVFRRELRGGDYTTHWISGQIMKLDAGLAEEVREAAYRGEALVVDGDHDERNKIVDTALGVSIQGKLGAQNQAVRLSTPIFGGDLLSTTGRALKIDLAGGQVLGRFENASGVPAVVGNGFGKGRALLLGFDMVGSVTREARWPAQLGSGLNWLLPQLPQSYAPGAYVPVTMTVTNAGQDVTAEVHATLPAGSRYINAQPQPLTTANPVVWRFPLAAGASQSLRLAFSAPLAEGAYDLATEIGTVRNDAYTPYAPAQSVRITVASAAARLPATQSQISALAVAANERNARDKAAADAGAAQAAIAAGNWSAAIDKLLSAIDWLDNINSVDVSAPRLALDGALKEAQWHWAETQ